MKGAQMNIYKDLLTDLRKLSEYKKFSEKVMPVMVYGLVASVLYGGAGKATKYISEKEVMKVTLHGKRDWRIHRQTVVLTYGKPNYEERKFIKLAKEAGEKFPIMKIQLKRDKGAR
jgi:hypothetical protein